MRNKVKITQNIITLLITLAGILGIISSTVLFIRDAMLETVAVETKAKILSVDYLKSERYATVTYKVEKLDYIVSTPLKESQESLTVNDSLKIKYDVRNPSQAIYNDHLSTITMIVIASIIVILITGPKSVKIINEYQSIRELKKNGIRIDATIADIYVDTKSPIHNKQFPYRIRAKYVNPVDNKQYVFDSDYTYTNLREKQVEYQKETIAVYLDKENTSIYYVDLYNMKEPDILEESIIENEKGNIKQSKGNGVEEEATN